MIRWTAQEKRGTLSLFKNGKLFMWGESFGTQKQKERLFREMRKRYSYLSIVLLD